MKKRILLVDDHQMFLDGLIEILSQDSDIQIVGAAKNGIEAMNLLKETEVDILISDISMPLMNGEELLLHTKKEYPHIKVILLTMDDSGKAITKLIEGGADSYLFKNSSKEELLHAIDKIATGEQFFGSQIQKALLDNIVPNRKQITMNEVRESLTEREKQILVMIADEFTQSEIAEKLFISPNTVVYHKRKLMLLLEVKSVAGLVRKAAELDLI